jgi:predicted N-formylglutamate amidohydrolase
MNKPANTLLYPDEPPAASIQRENGGSPFVIACDHAGNAIPRQLATLGLRTELLAEHIAWDIGAAGVARQLSRLLDAPVVSQTYSRLVVDCNRPPDAPDFIPIVSDGVEVPGNRDLSPSQRQARLEAIFDPYHQRLADLLDGRKAAGKPAVLVAVHSFTPALGGVARPWHIGILYNRDARLASLLISELHAYADLCVGDNQPYFVSDQTDYTLPVHGEARGIPHVETEIRQDLIVSDSSQEGWARRLAGWLSRCVEKLDLVRLSGE